MREMIDLNGCNEVNQVPIKNYMDRLQRPITHYCGMYDEIDPTVNSLQLLTNPDAAISDLAVNLSEITVVDYNFVAVGTNRNEIVERFDAEIATTATE